jgi:Skp family chaperone for outer membrane proteins
MKSITSILILCSFLVSSLFAQDGQKEERIKALRVAFITEELQLTSAEAEKFWPIYNEYEAERKKIRQEYRKEKKDNQMSDVEAEEMVDASFALQEKQLQLKRNYYDKLKTAIPAQKLVLLERAEKKFREKIINEIKRRKQERGGK